MNTDLLQTTSASLRVFLRAHRAFAVIMDCSPMDIFKIEAKLFTRGTSLPHDKVLRAFHRWIQEQSVVDHMLIDVADYAHVTDGPGTVLVSSQANFYLDHGGGRGGILYSRKLPFDGDFSARVRQAVTEAIKAAQRLSDDPALAGEISFATDELLIRLNDRLLAPANGDTVSQTEPAVRKLAEQIWGSGNVTVQTNALPNARVEFILKSKTSPELSQLLAKVETAAGK
jgi:hypothetical protein